ncbi:NIPSNAP family protein [Rhodotorula paludigena]|uniref:NIPSNAP family protein n=1 Tax=Rhodotorula paludigena TaxID=86838 RepID=UPI003182AA66
MRPTAPSLRALARPHAVAVSRAPLPTSAAALVSARALTTSGPAQAVKDFASAFLHGSEEAKEEMRVQHSKLVGRHKYVHEFQKHKVLPQHVEQYKEKIEGYYRGIHESSEFDARLTGSWEIVVGEVDSFSHIWEYDGLAGFERTKTAIRESRGHLQFFNQEILPLLDQRTSQLCSEFKFFPVVDPQEKGGIYELRTYDLKPGSLLEWEHEWRVGLEARIAAGHTPIGAWYAGIGRLHQVHMIWHYESLEARRDRRAQSWEQDAWSNTVSKTTRLLTSMQSQILKPLPYSPLR